MIEKVISGGQIGADEAGVRTAKAFGIPTGGTMPKNFLTLDGPKPEFKELYGMEEHSSPSYPPRTKLNVKNSDGTIRFAFDFNTAGERRTKKEIDAAHKPYFDVYLSSPKSDKHRLSKCIVWLEKHDIKVLNVAGNANEETDKMTTIYLTKLFTKLGFKCE
jgi:hypothetical protein